MEEKLRVGIYGATGAVGLEAVISLANHEWFEIAHLYASEKSAAKPFKDACELDTSIVPGNISEMIVEYADMSKVPDDIDIAFFALPEEIAKEHEIKYFSNFAKHLTIITTSSALRMHEKVPLIITEVNADHVRLAEDYKREFNSRGVPFPQSNCTAVPLVTSLRPLLTTVGIKEVMMVSYQSVSGAGRKAIERWGKERASKNGLPMPFFHDGSLKSPEIVYDGNIRPIGENDSIEEQTKVVREARKMLGNYYNGSIIPAGFSIKCRCRRVPTYIGHSEEIFIKPVRSCAIKDVTSIFEEYNERCKESYSSLPSSPEKTIVLLDRQPQTRHDAELNGGMSTIIGNIEIADGWIVYTALSNNLKKGAAKGSVQLLEYLFNQGFVKNKT